MTLRGWPGDVDLFTIFSVLRLVDPESEFHFATDIPRITWRDWPIKCVSYLGSLTPDLNYDPGSRLPEDDLHRTSLFRSSVSRQYYNQLWCRTIIYHRIVSYKQKLEGSNGFNIYICRERVAKAEATHGMASVGWECRWGWGKFGNGEGYGWMENGLMTSIGVLSGQHGWAKENSVRIKDGWETKFGGHLQKVKWQHRVYMWNWTFCHTYFRLVSAIFDSPL